MAKKRPFKKLRKRLAALLEALDATLPSGSIPPTVGPPDNPMTTMSGRMPTSDGGLILWDRPGAIRLSQPAAELVRQITIALLELPAHGDASSTRDIESEALKMIVERYRRANGEPAALVADRLVEVAVRLRDVRILVFAVKGFTPASGLALRIGTVWFYPKAGREALALVERLTFDTFADEGASRLKALDHLYRHHTLATIPSTGSDAHAGQVAREALDHALGAVSYFVLSAATVAPRRFGVAVGAEAWAPFISFFSGDNQGGPLRPYLGIGVIPTPVFVSTARIPVLTHHLYPLIDRLLSSNEADLAELEGRLRRCLFWLGKAVANREDDQVLILGFVCLETMFKCSLNKTDAVSQFVALMIGEAVHDPSARHEVIARIVTLYKSRSELIHNGVRAGSEDDSQFLIGMVVVGFTLLAELVGGGQLAHEFQLYEWLASHLPAGSDLDRFISSKLDFAFHHIPPPHSSNIAASTEVVEAMKVRGWSFTQREEQGSFLVEYSRGKAQVEHRASTQPLATCRGALLALSVAARTDQ